MLYERGSQQLTTPTISNNSESPTKVANSSVQVHLYEDHGTGTPCGGTVDGKNPAPLAIKKIRAS